MDPNELQITIRTLHDPEFGTVLHQDEVQRVLCEVGAHFADLGFPQTAQAFGAASDLFEFDRAERITPNADL